MEIDRLTLGEKIWVDAIMDVVANTNINAIMKELKLIHGISAEEEFSHIIANEVLSRIRNHGNYHHTPVT